MSITKEEIQEIVDDTFKIELFPYFNTKNLPLKLYNSLEVLSITPLSTPNNDYEDLRDEIIKKKPETHISFKKDPPLTLFDQTRIFRKFLVEYGKFIEWKSCKEVLLFGCDDNDKTLTELSVKADSFANPNKNDTYSLTIYKVLLGKTLAFPDYMKFEKKEAKRLLKLNGCDSLVYQASESTPERMFFVLNSHQIKQAYHITYNRSFRLGSSILLRGIDDDVSVLENASLFVSSEFLKKSRNWKVKIGKKNFTNVVKNLVKKHQIEEFILSKEIKMLFYPPSRKQNKKENCVYVFDGHDLKNIDISLFENQIKFAVPKDEIPPSKWDIKEFKEYLNTENGMVYRQNTILLKNGEFSKVDLPGWAVLKLNGVTIFDSPGAEVFIPQGSLIPKESNIFEETSRISGETTFCETCHLKNGVVFWVHENAIIPIYECLKKEEIIFFTNFSILIKFKSIIVLIQVRNTKMKMMVPNFVEYCEIFDSFDNIDFWKKTFSFYEKTLNECPKILTKLFFKKTEEIVEYTRIKELLSEISIKYVRISTRKDLEIEFISNLATSWFAILKFTESPLFVCSKFKTFHVEEFKKKQPKERKRSNDLPTIFLGDFVLNSGFDPQKNKFTVVRTFQEKFSCLTKDWLVKTSKKLLPVHFCTEKMFEYYKLFGFILPPNGLRFCYERVFFFEKFPEFSGEKELVRSVLDALFLDNPEVNILNLKRQNKDKHEMIEEIERKNKLCDEWQKLADMVYQPGLERFKAPATLGPNKNPAYLKPTFRMGKLITLILPEHVMYRPDFYVTITSEEVFNDPKLKYLSPLINNSFKNGIQVFGDIKLQPIAQQYELAVAATIQSLVKNCSSEKDVLSEYENLDSRLVLQAKIPLVPIKSAKILMPDENLIDEATKGSLKNVYDVYNLKKNPPISLSSISPMVLKHYLDEGHLYFSSKAPLHFCLGAGIGKTMEFILEDQRVVISELVGNKTFFTREKNMDLTNFQNMKIMWNRKMISFVFLSLGVHIDVLFSEISQKEFGYDWVVLHEGKLQNLYFSKTDESEYFETR